MLSQSVEGSEKNELQDLQERLDNKIRVSVQIATFIPHYLLLSPPLLKPSNSKIIADHFTCY